MDNDIVLVHPVDLAPADHSTKKDYARKYHLVDPPFNDNLRHEERRAEVLKYLCKTPRLSEPQKWAEALSKRVFHEMKVDPQWRSSHTCPMCMDPRPSILLLCSCKFRAYHLSCMRTWHITQGRDELIKCPQCNVRTKPVNINWVLMPPSEKEEKMKNKKKQKHSSPQQKKRSAELSILPSSNIVVEDSRFVQRVCAAQHSSFKNSRHPVSPTSAAHGANGREVADVGYSRTRSWPTKSWGILYGRAVPHAEHEDSLCSEPTLIPPCAASRLASFNTLLFKELMTYFTTRWPICWKSQARGIEYASPSPKKPSHTKGVRAAGRGGHFGGASSELDMIDLADKLQSRHRLRAIQQRLRRAPRYDLPESGQHYDEKTQQDAWFAPPPTSGAVADASLGGVALRVVAGMVGASMGVVAAPPAPAAPADTEAANAGRGTSTPNGTNANQSEFRIFPYHAPHLVPFEAAVRALNPAGAVLVRNAAVTAAVGRVPSSHQSLNLDAETRIQVLARTADLPGAEKAQCGAFIRTPPSLVLWAPQVESLIPLVAEFEEKLFKYDCTASDLHSYCRHLPPLVGVIVAHSPALALSLLFSI
ncbi:hypothetical protein B0H16DRAFT_1726911 [Mycena metata]|uniref:RING-type domain-containing protein n=1 Tax=Mycena metata TaxID=1033252 RepID=A0AAD7IKQ3_9AGAR|nr:hypothetical protein B0H16DRAFT_1726911 [Mycena metata]